MVGYLKKFLSISIMLILLGSLNTILAETTILEGSMVGKYQFEVSEKSDIERPNIVNLTLTGEIIGVNRESPYYNCGVAERLMAVKCRIPEQSYAQIHHLDRTMMYNSRYMDYDPNFGRWFCFLTASVFTFSITLQGEDSVVTFTIETETDFIDPASNSSQTVSESASFNYFVQTDYSYVLRLESFFTREYLAVFIIVIIFIVALTKILPEERAKT